MTATTQTRWIALALLALVLLAQASVVRIGFVRRNAAFPVGGAVGSAAALAERLFEEEHVMAGLQFWADQFNAHHVEQATQTGVTEAQIIAAYVSDPTQFGDAYLALALGATPVNVFVGPLGCSPTHDTLAVLLTALANTSLAAPLPFFSLCTDDELVASAYPLLGSVLPDTNFGPQRLVESHLPAIKDLLHDGAYTYAALTRPASTGDDDDAVLFHMTEHIVQDLTDGEGALYTLQHFGTFVTTADLGAQLARVDRFKPRPDLLILSMPVRLHSTAGTDELIAQFEMLKK